LSYLPDYRLHLESQNPIYNINHITSVLSETDFKKPLWQIVRKCKEIDSNLLVIYIIPALLLF